MTDSQDMSDFHAAGWRIVQPEQGCIPEATHSRLLAYSLRQFKGIWQALAKRDGEAIGARWCSHDRADQLP